MRPFVICLSGFWYFCPLFLRELIDTSDQSLAMGESFSSEPSPECSKYLLQSCWLSQKLEKLEFAVADTSTSVCINLGSGSTSRTSCQKRNDFPEIFNNINLLTASMAFSTASSGGPIVIRLPVACLTHHTTPLEVFQPSECPVFNFVSGDNATHCAILVAFSGHYWHAHPKGKKQHTGISLFVVMTRDPIYTS